jgi:diguanylate cyclase (GGDEF)-like protein
VGLILLRRCLALDFSFGAVTADLAGDSVTYIYLTISTMVAFIGCGIFLGRSADRLRTSATTDPLTGLANRRKCEERVLLELKRVDRYGYALSLLLIDVDRLKQINDERGHEEGDLALRSVAGALAVSCRGTDLAARWGGDEFTVLAPGTTADEALRLASRIREALQQNTSSSHARTTVSIGISDVAHVRSRVPEDLYAAADAALYEAKAMGRDRAVIYSSGLRAK